MSTRKFINDFHAGLHKQAAEMKKERSEQPPLSLAERMAQSAWLRSQSQDAETAKKPSSGRGLNRAA